MESESEIFRYSSGRWIYNERLRLSERYRRFDVAGLKRLAAEAVGRSSNDVIGFEKLAEGGFNRTFLVTMQDSLQLVARIPYPVTEPKQLVIASEVATLNFLGSHSLPVPKIYGYSTTCENIAETEYIFMEFLHGHKLGDTWYSMTDEARRGLVSKIVELEEHMFSLEFPANGSLYHPHDLSSSFRKVDVPGTAKKDGLSYCIGPSTALSLWFGRRAVIDCDRGPHTEPEAVLGAGAQKELLYIQKYGQPLHPFRHFYREIYDYDQQSPNEFGLLLKQYLQICPHLVPTNSPSLCRPVIRHPDLQPNNIFVDEAGEITGLIDWQHCSILPAFLQCGIPNHFQNYDDTAHDPTDAPALPDNFDQLEEEQQAEQLDLLRRRQLHYFYVKETARRNPLHWKAMTQNFSMLKRKLYHHATEPWEGDNVTLKADLIHLTQNWQDIAATSCCPVSFAEAEVAECLQLHDRQAEADQGLKTFEDIIGMGPEGWVPSELYEEVKQRSIKFRADTVDAAESELDRERINAHWPFDDFDEEMYR